MRRQRAGAWVRGIGILVGVGGLIVVAPSVDLRADTTEPRHVEVLPWKSPHIVRALGSGRSELGLSGNKIPVEMKRVAGRLCAVGNLVAFDVDDTYAFDIDETVDLTLTYATEGTGPFSVAWDRNSGDGYGVIQDIAPEAGALFRTLTLKLDRARLSGQGVQRTDLAVGGRNGVALCDLTVTRSNTTPAPAGIGRLQLEVKDAETGRPIPARVGLYDATGRIPLPSDMAPTLHRYADQVRLQWLNARTPWPSAHRQAFYVDGTYRATVPIGTYDLIVSRGPEYKTHVAKVTISTGAVAAVPVSLQRYADLPAAGWYSGESHIHHPRVQAKDDAVWTMVAGEDLHVGNLLEMGNIAGSHYEQPAWGAAGRYARGDYVLVSGQEDPRTAMRGHTIHWNIQEHSHFPPGGFFQYHNVFEKTRSQGGLVGYAHLGELFNGRRGLALDVPFGLIDFIEVLQGGRINTEIWYSFLNLGYKVLPVGGADYPYFGPTLPGVERTYVKVDGAFSADAWFAAARRGRMYVTNGPLLDFTVNGKPMGETLDVAPGTLLDVVADAKLNPDVDALDRVEIVVHGEVVATAKANGKDRVTLRAKVPAKESLWIAARAYGVRTAPQPTAIAHSAPIYILVGGLPSWKPSEVVSLVAHQRQMLTDLMTMTVDPIQDLEPWETRELLVAEWERQRPILEPRVKEADARYAALLDRFTASRRADGSR